jgi:hypothetical protein
MRVIGLTVAAIIPAALAAAVFAYPAGGTSGKVAADKADAARTLVEYVPPPHVRVIPIYAAASTGH